MATKRMLQCIPLLFWRGIMFALYYGLFIVMLSRTMDTDHPDWSDDKKQDRLYYCIATDKYNLLKDNDNMIVYFFKKLYYRIKLSFKHRRIIK